MIIQRWLEQDKVDEILKSLAPESDEAREAIDAYRGQIFDESFDVARFLELLLPHDEIIIMSRLYHVIFNKNGTIYTFDVYPKNIPELVIYLSWDVIKHRTVMEMSPKGRQLLSSRFNWKAGYAQRDEA